MVQPALSAADRRALERTMRSTHSERCRVDVLDMDGEIVESITGRLLTGNISCDVGRDVAVTCRLSLDDRHHGRFGGRSSSRTQVGLDRLIRVWVQVAGPLLSEPVEVPVFTGVLTLPVSDEGSTLTIEAQGKEALGLREAWFPTTFPKGTRKTEVIKTILREYPGERARSMRVPDRDERIPRELTVARGELPWKVAERLAKSMGMVLHYDAMGVAVLRRLPRHVSAVDRTGTGGSILEPVRVRTDAYEVVNAIRVRGHEPLDPCRKQVTATAVAPRRHPLSPQSLGQNGVPRYLPRTIEDDDIRTPDEAQRVADEALREGLRLTTEVQYAALPDFTIEPYDLRRVETDSGVHRVRVRSYELPLGPGRMTVGYRDARTRSLIRRSM